MTHRTQMLFATSPKPALTHHSWPTRRGAAALFALLGMLGSTPSALGQTQPPPDAGRLLEETRPNTRPVLPAANAPKLIEAPARPTLTLPEGTTVAVTEFRISGATSYPAAQLAALVKPWQGRRLDINGLNDAAGAITRFYQSAGHLLTYAYLPAQRVADGVIELAVLEGRLEGVQVVTAQDVRLRDEVIQAHTDGLVSPASGPGSAPAAPGQPAPPPLLQADVERKLLLLNDIPGVAARAAFTPGSSTGGAEMVVSVAEDEPLELRADFNNHGSKSTGEYRAGITLQLRDLFGWGDHTLARALVSNKGGLVSGSLGSSVPLGGDGMKLGATLSRLTYQLGGNFRNLGAVGNANAFGVDLGWAPLRSTDANIGLKLGLETKRLRDDIQLVASTNPKRSDAVEISASFDFRDGWGGASNVTAGNVAVSQGDLRFLNDDRRALDDTGLNTGGQYRKLLAQVVRQQALYGPYSLLLRAVGQYTPGNLDSSEKLGLGGPGAVRAYAPGEATVDQGGLLSLEGRYSLDYIGGNLVLALFHDRAQGRISRLPLVAANNNPHLRGSGLAVQWNGGDLSLSASLAWRGPSKPTAEGGDASPRVYLQLSLTP